MRHCCVCTVRSGVIIGGQIAPRLQGKFSQKTVLTAMAVLFAVIGAAFAVVSIESLMKYLNTEPTV